MSDELAEEYYKLLSIHYDPEGNPTSNQEFNEITGNIKNISENHDVSSDVGSYHGHGGMGDMGNNIDEEEQAKKIALAKLMAAVTSDSKNSINDAWFKSAMLKKLEPQNPVFMGKMRGFVSSRRIRKPDEVQTLSQWFPEILFDRSPQDEKQTFHEGIFFFKAPDLGFHIINKSESNRFAGPVDTERALAEYINTASKYYFNQYLHDNNVSSLVTTTYTQLINGNDLEHAVECLNDFFEEYASNDNGIVIDIPPNSAAPYSDILLSRAIIGLLLFSQEFAVTKNQITPQEFDIIDLYDTFFSWLNDRVEFVLNDNNSFTRDGLKQKENEWRQIQAEKSAVGGSAAAANGPASFAMAIVTSLAVVLTSTLVGAMT